MSSPSPNYLQPVPWPAAPASSVLPGSVKLPSTLTPFTGRQSELARICELLSKPEVLLVTLTGPGGIGKTRLALAVAHREEAAFEDGAVFVDLSPIRDPAQVLPAIAHAVGLREASDGQPLAELISRVLTKRRMLLVLDNFEQVIAAAPEIGELLGSCPDLKILVTSRANLGLSTEHVVKVPPLALPARNLNHCIPELAQVESVALFVKRAQAANPTFELAEENASAVVDICGRLDGLPLALELAAARVKIVSPGTMVSLLERRLPLLSGGRRDAPTRHRTLRETIAWSYDLLGEDEQTLFRWLGVFAGGCTLEAIAAVSGLDEPTDQPVVDGLETLITQNLLRFVELPNGDQRFTTLETIHEFALEQLETTGELEAARRAHAMYFLGLAERSDALLTGPDQELWFERYEAEHDNLRAALGWLLPNDPNVAVQFAGSLWRFWWSHGHLVEGRRWLEEAIATGAGDSANRARALYGAGGISLEQGNYEHAHVRLNAALAEYRRTNDQEGEAKVLTDLGLLARDQGEFAQSLDFHTQALALRRATEDRRGIATSLANLGVVASMQGDYQSAEEQLNEAADTFRGLRDPTSLGAVLSMLADMAARRGDYGRANRIVDEAMPLLRQLGDPSATAIALVTVGSSLRAQNQHADAVEHYQEALELFREASHHRGEAGALTGLAAVALDKGEIAKALPLLEESLRLLGPTGDQELLLGALDDLARTLSLRGEFVESAQIYGAVERIREVKGAPRTVAEEAVHQAVIEALRIELGTPEYEAAVTAGREMQIEDVVAKALELVVLRHQPEDALAPVHRAQAFNPDQFGLTPREVDVLRLVAAGRTNQEIADALGIGITTVKTHVVRVLSKLEVSSRAGAAAFAIRNGLS